MGQNTNEYAAHSRKMNTTQWTHIVMFLCKDKNRNWFLHTDGKHVKTDGILPHSYIQKHL